MRYMLSKENLNGSHALSLELLGKKQRVSVNIRRGYG
jgi:hypothetical protein